MPCAAFIISGHSKNSLFFLLSAAAEFGLVLLHLVCQSTVCKQAMSIGSCVWVCFCCSFTAFCHSRCSAQQTRQGITAAPVVQGWSMYCPLSLVWFCSQFQGPHVLLHCPPAPFLPWLPLPAVFLRTVLVYCSRQAAIGLSSRPPCISTAVPHLLAASSAGWMLKGPPWAIVLPAQGHTFHSPSAAPCGHA